MNLSGQRVAVVGAAATGIATARVLSRRGAFVTVLEQREAASADPKRLDELEGMVGVTVVWGTSALPDRCDLVVPSPGVRPSAPPLREALSRGVPVLSEIEIGGALSRAPILAVTGTNGKTTTTAMLAALCRDAGRTVFACGNLATDAGVRLPLIEAADEAAPDALLVAEVSSFQLEWTREFRPRAAAWLNLSDDHGDAYASMDAYASEKAKLLANQTSEDLAVLNVADPWVVRQSEGVGAGRRVWFDGQHPDLAGLVGMSPCDLQVPGRHNVANAVAAAAIALDLGISADTIADSLRRFPGVPHRMEAVGEIDGVRYVNNSMCTNPVALAASLAAVDGSVVVIVGGRDKALDLDALAAPLVRRGCRVVLIGEAAEAIATSLRRAGGKSPIFAVSMVDAVTRARDVAGPGDTVLLAPGCASFDMFTGFEHRGQAFREAVQGLKRP